MTTDFQYLVMAMVFIAGPPNYLLMVPPAAGAWPYHWLPWLPARRSRRRPNACSLAAGLRALVPGREASAPSAPPPFPLSPPQVPFVVLATYHVFAHLAQHYSHTALWKARGEKAWGWLRQRQRDALLLNAMAEIGLAITTLLLLFTSLSLLPKAYLLWQMLKVRFWTPDSHAYQRMAWAKLDERTRSIRAMLPLADKLVGWVQRWFQAVPGR
jgi:hypothetical protein